MHGVKKTNKGVRISVRKGKRGRRLLEYEEGGHEGGKEWRRAEEEEE